jgi:hypothetical protein
MTDAVPSQKRVSAESRRSTRVPLRVWIEGQGISEALTCEGETVVVNLHGAMIVTSNQLHVGMSIAIYVVLTDKRASAKVVYVDPDRPLHCGIALDRPQNIWGLSLPPEDWREGESE